MSAIVAAASAGGEPVARRSRQRRRVWRPVLAAAAATLLLPVGLAVAGISLPNAVEQPYRTVGITLPHQTRSAYPAPATRPRTPTTTPATAEPPRQADQQSRHPRAGHGQRNRAKRQANPADRAGRQDKSRGSSVRPRPRPSGTADKHGLGPRRPAGPQHKPTSPKPSAGSKQGKSNKPTSPRRPRTDRGQPRQQRDAPKPPPGNGVPLSHEQPRLSA